jgi:O-antigen/teichoic acid export membrane protein
MPEHDLTAGAIERRGHAQPWGRIVRLLHEGWRSRLLRNILTLASGTAGAQALAMAFMPIITRLYGPEAYGVLGVFMGLAMMMVPVAALTYPIAIVLPKRDADARGLVRLSLAIAVLIALLAAALLASFGDALVERMGIEEVAPYLMLLPLVMLCGAGLEIAQQWLIRVQRFSLSARVAVLHALTHNTIRTLGGLIHAVPAVLVITTALGPALHALMLLVGIRRTTPEADRRTPSEGASASAMALARRHQDFPLFRAPLMLINTVSQNLPTLVLAAFFGAAAAGFFTLCKQALSMPTQLIGKSVADVYYPRLAQAIQRREPVTGMLAKATAGLALVGLVPFALVFGAGPWLFALVFGPAWETAGEFARWLALAEYTIFITRPCSVAVPALALQGRFLIFEALSTGLRVAALLSGALLLEEARLTVIAFTCASILIYLSLIVIVLIESRRWYARQHRPN